MFWNKGRSECGNDKVEREGMVSHGPMVGLYLDFKMGKVMDSKNKRVKLTQ